MLLKRWPPLHKLPVFRFINLEQEPRRLEQAAGLDRHLSKVGCLLVAVVLVPPPGSVDSDRHGQSVEVDVAGRFEPWDHAEISAGENGST
eukprot:27822-Rhodomonas_salina.1